LYWDDPNGDDFTPDDEPAESFIVGANSMKEARELADESIKERAKKEDVPHLDGNPFWSGKLTGIREIE